MRQGIIIMKTKLKEFYLQYREANKAGQLSAYAIQAQTQALGFTERETDELLIAFKRYRMRPARVKRSSKVIRYNV
jgi:hypothetical protein